MSKPTKKTSSLTHKITFRVSEEEHERFKSLFRNACLNRKKYSLSDFVRDAIFANDVSEKVIIQREKVVIRDRPCKDESAKIYQLSRIGNNLNQLAHYANKERDIDEKILKELQEIKEYLKALQ